MLRAHCVSPRPIQCETVSDDIQNSYIGYEFFITRFMANVRDALVAKIEMMNYLSNEACVVAIPNNAYARTHLFFRSGV